MTEVPGNTPISDEAVQAFADAAVTYMFERGILNPEDVRDGLRAALPLLVSAEAERAEVKWYQELLATETRRVEGLRAELAEKALEAETYHGMSVRLNDQLAALRSAYAPPADAVSGDTLWWFADASLGDLQAVLAGSDAELNRQAVRSIASELMAVRSGRAALRAAGGQEKPTSCGMGCEAGVNVQCVEHGPKWPVRAPVGGQAEPSDEASIRLAAVRKLAQAAVDEWGRMAFLSRDIHGNPFPVTVDARAVLAAAAVSGEQVQPDGENENGIEGCTCRSLFGVYHGPSCPLASASGGGRPTGTDNEGGQR